MNQDPRAQRILSRFDQAQDYEHKALAQRRLARLLAKHIKVMELAPARILEVGCGTGFATSELVGLYPQASLLATDASPGMLTRARAMLGNTPGVSFTFLDMNDPALLSPTTGQDADTSAPFDLVVSAMALHWSDSLPKTLAALTGVLRPGGRLVASLPAPACFIEWRESLSALNLPCGLLAFPGEPALRAAAPSNCAFELTTASLSLPLGSPMSFVRELRATGASEPRPGYVPLSAGDLRAAARQLAEHGQITWTISLLTLIKE